MEPGVVTGVGSFQNTKRTWHTKQTTHKLCLGDALEKRVDRKVRHHPVVQVDDVGDCVK